MGSCPVELTGLYRDLGFYTDSSSWEVTQPKFLRETMISLLRIDGQVVKVGAGRALETNACSREGQGVAVMLLDELHCLPNVSFFKFSF